MRENTLTKRLNCDSNLLKERGLQFFVIYVFQIEILKRLQREAFSDLMKLRDRQDKVERILSLYKTAKGSPFQEVGTVVRGEFDILGALVMRHNVEHDDCDVLSRAGIRTGVDSRFSFETTVRENDNLVVEFVSGQKNKGNMVEEGLGSSLSLAKVFYTASAGDWLSAFVIPMGGKCSDVAIVTNPSHQVPILINLIVVSDLDLVTVHL